MTTRTRYFVITSLLVLGIGVGTGLLAYYVGLPGGLLADRDGPEELRYVPRDAAVVAYADVREIMASDVRQRIRRVMPVPQDGQRQFQDQTGIDIESDIDHVVASLQPHPDGRTVGLLIARGRFSDVKIEALMREHGAEVEDYNGKRLIVQRPAAPGSPGPVDSGDVRRAGGDAIALSFLEPGLVAVGSGQMLRVAIDLQKSGDNVTKNSELMDQLRSLDRGNAWAIGRFDAVRSDTRLPPQITSQIPVITWFSVAGRLDSDIHGVLRAETRDEEAANTLRDVVRGFLGLAKLQAGTRPGFQAMMQSLDLGGTGNTVALSFSIPGELFDAFGVHPEAPQAPAAH